ncbi:MAG TPA: DNA-binding transcriptional regulator [Isosphaeraceae bacterium]|nr:DNA-binding transcriptional regulator [Isosphaeraceae bacterium]
MTRRPRVALLIETSTIVGRRLLQGITRYLRSHRSWSIFLEQREVDTVRPDWLRTWRGDGVISRWSSPYVVQALRERHLAAVDLSNRRPAFGLPRINPDDQAIGRLAAEHLLERRFPSFAYCGFSGVLWATRRKEAFLEELARAGQTGHVYESPWREPGAHLQEDEQARIGHWLQTLPRPVGILTPNDVRGIDVLDACQTCGLRVPDEVAVIGVDDDALLCEICYPPLSSIVPNTEQIGYEAAALLDQLMEGDRADFAERFVLPVGVTTRLSTDVLAGGDEDLAAAVRFIRENACHGVTVADVLEHVAISRSTLERKFRSCLGRSPQAEIRTVQLARAKQLLAEADHAIHRIAELVGYQHIEYFNVVFKREVGQTPGQYRHQVRTLKTLGPRVESD